MITEDGIPKGLNIDPRIPSGPGNEGLHLTLRDAINVDSIRSVNLGSYRSGGVTSHRI
jgi:hypothetical protein